MPTFSTHMQDLQEVTQEVHYENYRSERLAKGVPVPKRTTYDYYYYIVICYKRSIFLYYSKPV